MLRFAWPFLMCLVLACHAPARVQTVTPVPAAIAPAAPAASAAPPAPAAPPHFGRIEEELAALRGLPFVRPVPYARETQADFRARVHKELGRELPQEKNAVLSRAYVELGLAPAGFNLLSTLEDALTTQVAAYYDPESKSFRLLKDPRNKDTDDIVVAHELTHALDDQHFDLETYDGGPGNRLGLSEETRTARQFVTEGEATFMMVAWKAAGGQGKNKHLGPLSLAGLRMGLAMVGAADMVELMATARQGRSLEELSPEERKELDEMSKLPPMISLSLIEPYFKGAAFISEVWGRGGWAAVNDLYRHPPDSTEQILHFKEKFFDKRDPPIEIALPLERRVLVDKPADTDVMGELGVRAYFKTWDHPDGDSAAAGWGGDRFWAWTRASGQLVLWATCWDSEKDAREFLEAYLDTLEPRFPKSKVEAAGPNAWRVRLADGNWLHVARQGRDVDIIQGARLQEIPEIRTLLRSLSRNS